MDNKNPFKNHAREGEMPISHSTPQQPVAPQPVEPTAPQQPVEPQPRPAEPVAPQQPVEPQPQPAEPVAPAQPSPQALYEQGEQLINAGNAMQALQCYRQAAQMGHVESVFRLGQIFEFGMTGTTDLNAARQLYEMAANQGHPLAAQRLQELTAPAAPVTPEPAAQPQQPYYPTPAPTKSAAPRTAIIAVVAILLLGALGFGAYKFLGSSNKEKVEDPWTGTTTQTTATTTGNESNTTEAVTEVKDDNDDTPAAPEQKVSETYILPHYGGNVDPGEVLAENAARGNFACTYAGMTADRLKDFDAKKTGDQTLQITAADGYKYLYFFDKPVGSAANPSHDAVLTGVAVSVKGVSIEDWADTFDVTVVEEGAKFTSTPHLYRMPDGNYASAGYVTKSGTFWVYYYYPNSPTRNQAAPRK